MKLRSPQAQIIKKCLLCGLFLCIICSQLLFSQEPGKLTREQFNSGLRQALAGNDEPVITSLISGNRLYVKPFVDELIRESLSDDLKGNSSEALKVRTFSRKAATRFEDIFGEKSLSVAVGYADKWTREQKILKLHADSLYVEATKFRLGNEPEKALRAFQTVQSEYTRIGDERGEAEVLGGLGALYFNNLKEYQKALEYYQEALIMRLKTDDRILIGNTLNSLGALYYTYLVNYPEALKYFEKARALRSEIGDLAGLRGTLAYKAGALKSYGEFLSNAARYNEAIAALEESCKINSEIQAGYQTGEALSLLGFVLTRVGDYGRALGKLSAAEKIMKEENDTIGLAGVFNNLGVTVQRAGRPEKALDYFMAALKIYEERNLGEDEINVLNNIGIAYFDMRDYLKAEEYHARGLSLCREQSEFGNMTTYLLNLANDRIMLGKSVEALSDYTEGLKIARSVNNPDLVWRFMLGMAECHEARGNIGKVIELNDSALSIIDNIRGSLEDDGLKASLIARERFVFEDIIDLLLQLHEKDPSKGYDSLAFSYAEESKSRVLLDLLSGTEAPGQEPSKGISGQTKLVRLSEVSDLVPDKRSVILEYSVGDSSSSLWAITGSARRLYRLPGKKRLQEQIESLRFSLQDPSPVISDFFIQSSSELYNELVRPAEFLLRPGSRLIIIPDGVLNYLPFEVLLTSGPGKAGSYPFLIRKYDVSYVQSASVLRTLIAKSAGNGESGQGRGRLLAFGDPVYEESEPVPDRKYPRLEFSAREIENIAALFAGEASETYLRENATEENLKTSVLNNFRYIHFATHGFVDEAKPELSALVLTRSTSAGEDGYLRASEISQLKMNCDMVVLSACQTGLGKLVRGEGMVGLTRAFLLAGANSVMVSLWSVSDNSTAVLMGEFYKNLIKGGRNKADALARAKLTMINDKKYSHPFYWAPFVLVGGW